MLKAVSREALLYISTCISNSTTRLSSRPTPSAECLLLNALPLTLLRMDTLYHREEHFRGGDTVKDIVIGMSDGLTVPFALAAGISGAISAAHIVVTAGFAEIAAGSIAMGLGGYLAARSEVEHYRSELAREEAEIREKPEIEAEEVASFFREYGLTEDEYTPVVAGLRTRPKAWRDFMMRFELGLEEPDPKRALQSAITIALSYVAGGIVPWLRILSSTTSRRRSTFR